MRGADHRGRRSWALGLALLVAGGLAGCEEQGDRPDGASLLWSDAGSVQNPCVAPGGDEVVVTRYHDGYGEGAADLWIVDLETGEPRELLADGARNVNQAGSCWHETTGDILFASDREDDRWELYRLDPDDGVPVRVTERPGLAATEPTWSQSGEWVVFTSRPEDDPDGPGALARVRADGSEELLLTPEGADDRHPVASPAGNLVALETWDGQTWTVAMSDLEGGFREALTDAAGDDLQPSWAWTGEQVVFASTREGQDQPDLYTVQIEGCEIARVTDDEGHDGAPAFTPGGGYILFEGLSEGQAREDGTDLWFIPSPSS